MTDPEPPPPDHPWTQPNVVLTPHVAVAGGSCRLAEFVGASFEGMMRGEPPLSVIKL